jgi:hypothetical protein
MSSRTLIAVVALSAGCSLFKFTVKDPEAERRAAEEQQAREVAAREQAEAQAKAAAEEDAAAQKARDEATVAELEALRADLTRGPDGGKALAFAGKVSAAKQSPAARDGRLDLDLLQPEALGYLERAIEATPTYELFLALDVAAGGAEGDRTVQRACPRVRPQVPAEARTEFTAICLQRAGGDPQQLKWPEAKADLTALRKAQEAQARAEREAAAAEAKAAEEAAKAGINGAVYAIAGVFAAGRCEFGDCMKNGWTTRTDAGEVRVRCNFGNCLKDGWTAQLPGGGEARTRCNFGDCMKDGWETSYPDGSSARTRCNFSNCAKDGWETSLPGGGSARTRCNFGECFTDGWETSLPDGGSVRCTCNFKKCLTDGTSCQ